jgi:hypothetical protein
VKALDSILDVQLLAIFICLAAIGMSVRIIATFSGEAARLRPKLTKISDTLTTMRERMSNRMPIIEALEKVIEPLSNREQILREYFEQLTQIELTDMRKDAEVQKEKEGKGIRRRGSVS